MLKKIGLAVVALLVVLAVVVATRPSHYRIVRSASIKAPAPAVYAQLVDFHRWEAWSPWEKLDPGMQKVFSGPDGLAGASYAWKGNDKVGEGRMTLTDARPEAIAIRLEFLKPMASVSVTTFLLAPEVAATQVTWTMEGDNDFIGKAFCMVMDMDKMVGGDFERGLASLKTVAEQQTAAVPAVAR